MSVTKDTAITTQPTGPASNKNKNMVDVLGSLPTLCLANFIIT